MSEGDADAADELLPIVYDELHRIADRLMGKERAGHTLQPTALIHEAFVKLVHAREDGWDGRSHFMRVAARAMRSVLIDHARAQMTQKRGGGRRVVTLHDEQAFGADQAAQVLAVHEGIDALGAIDKQLASIVELRFFGGFSHQEIAELIDTSLRSIERGWRFARAWLEQYLSEGDEVHP